MIQQVNIHLQRKVVLQLLNQNAAFSSKALPLNTIILFVPQQEAWVIERFGKFNRILDPVSFSNCYNNNGFALFSLLIYSFIFLLHVHEVW